MLTTDEIRALNEARDILTKLQGDSAGHRSDRPDSWDDPDGWDYGRISSTASHADWLLFSVLNEMSACHAQQIPELLLHNREENPTRALGRADVTIESEDDGFHLVVHADRGLYVFEVGDGADLLGAVRAIADHWAEGRAAAAEHQRQIDDADIGGVGAYNLDDPKSPGYHDRMSDLADRRKP